MKRGLILFLILMGRASADETICSAALPRFLDPHQMINPLQLEISKKLFISLFGNETNPALLKSWTTKDNLSWTLTLKDNFNFHKTQGWRSFRPINALDVEYSIKRQLTKFALNEVEKLTYLPAKWAQLDLKIKEIKPTKPYELVITFTEPVRERELKYMFLEPVGYITSKEFVDWKPNQIKEFLFHPASGSYDYLENDSSILKILPFKEKANLAAPQGIISYKAIESKGLTLKKAKAQNCERIFNPPAEILNELKLSGIKYDFKIVNKAKVFFHLNPKLELKNETLQGLHDILQPETFREFLDFRKLTSFMGTEKYYPSLKTPYEKKDYDQNKIYYCRSAVSGSIDYESVAQKISDKLEKALGIRISLTALNCNMLFSAINREDALGVLKSINYNDEEQLLRFISCDFKDSTNYFGICLKGHHSLDEKAIKEIETVVFKFKYLFPFVELENYMIRL